MSGTQEDRTLADRIEALASPVARGHGVTLVDVDLRRGGRRTALTFVIDKPGGVTLADCQRFSEEVGDLLDVADLIPESYDLEVSSPGLERELRKERELQWAVGRRVRVFTREPVAGRRELVGRLVAVDERALSLAEGEAPLAVPRGVVARIRLEMEPRRRS